MSLKPKIKIPSEGFWSVREAVGGLNTVCKEAKCPNISECWSGGTATFMVMGDTCTRACKFCNVKTFYRGNILDPEEPRKLAESVERMGLDYVVITSVDRDDLPDQGAGHFSDCIRKVKELGVLVEVLIPDFRGSGKLIERIVSAGPDVVAHNIETVKRLQTKARDPRAGYDQSLGVLKIAREMGAKFTKSSIMVGIGETDIEVMEAMEDLRSAGVDFLTIGQYLQPSPKHLPVTEFVSQERFDFFRTMGEDIGFKYVASGPLVRSSYRAGELFLKNVIRKPLC